MNHYQHRRTWTQRLEQGRGIVFTALTFTCGAALSLGLPASRMNAQETLAPEILAAETTGCFMVDAAGKTISLGALCGYSAPEPKASRVEPSANGGNAGEGGELVNPAAGSATGVVQVPIVRRSGRTPVIAVTFNGQGTYEMILDTGASGTLITARMAEELGVEPNGIVEAEIADGSRVEFLTAEVQSIAVSDARVDNVNVAIAMDTDIGLLGHDFFGDFDISIRESVVEFSRR